VINQYENQINKENLSFFNIYKITKNLKSANELAGFFIKISRNKSCGIFLLNIKQGFI